MIRRGNQIIRNYMTLEYKFTGVRIQDGFLGPVDWEINVDLIATTKKGKLKEDWEYKAATIFQKLYFWLDTNMPNIVIVNVKNENDLYVANLCSNVMMYCPGSTGDDMIVRLLHSKLASLTESDLTIGQIKLKSSDSVIQYTFDCQNNEYMLPTTTEEYYTEGKVKDKIPWWNRNDGFCFEFIRPENTDLSDEELFKDIVDPLDEFERLLLEANAEDTNITMVKEPAKIVQIEKWKPKKIE